MKHFPWRTDRRILPASALRCSAPVAKVVAMGCALAAQRHRPAGRSGSAVGQAQAGGDALQGGLFFLADLAAEAEEAKLAEETAKAAEAEAAKKAEEEAKLAAKADAAIAKHDEIAQE